MKSSTVIINRLGNIWISPREEPDLGPISKIRRIEYKELEYHHRSSSNRKAVTNSSTLIEMSAYSNTEEWATREEYFTR